MRSSAFERYQRLVSGVHVTVATNQFWLASNVALVVSELWEHHSVTCAIQNIMSILKEAATIIALHLFQLSPPCPHYFTSGLHMFRKNSMTEMQYICLGYFVGKSHKNVPENTSSSLLARKIFLSSDFRLF
jgi:hypothetical protein